MACADCLTTSSPQGVVQHNSSTSHAHQIKFSGPATTNPWIAVAPWQPLSHNRGGLPHGLREAGIHSAASQPPGFIVSLLRSRVLPRHKQSSLASTALCWRDRNQNGRPAIRTFRLPGVAHKEHDAVCSPSKMDVLDLQSALRCNNHGQPGTTNANKAMHSSKYSTHLPNTAAGSYCAPRR